MARTAARSGDDEPDSDDGQATEGGELPERLSPQAAGRIWTSSMGLSFVVTSRPVYDVLSAMPQFTYLKEYDPDADRRHRGPQTGHRRTTEPGRGGGGGRPAQP
ncbi:hypothetical protein [Streptomyces sp. NPDC002172]